MKKLLAILCAVMLVLTCSISVFAEGEESTVETPSYKITISNAENGKTYTAYKMLDLKYNGNAYYYTVAEGWNDFFTGEGAGANYVTIDSESKAVTWKDADASVELKASQAAALAAAAIEYVKANSSIKAADSKTADGTTATLEVDALGYYLVDSNLGSICSIDSTTPNADIKEKNTVPTVNKEVKEGETYGDSNTASIGDKVEFKSTVNTGKGLVTLTWLDKMSKGLTYDNTSLKITVNEADVATSNYTVTYVTTTEGITNITVEFTREYLKTLAENTDIVITYSATLNEDAIIAGNGNENEVNIKYGENNEFLGTPDKTTTYSYAFDLVKTDSNGDLLAGAGFKLYAADGETEIPVVLVNAETYTYRVAVEGETGVEMITNATKYLTIEGLDYGTYYLKETTVPTGYNPIAPVEFTIKDGNIETSMEGTKWVDGNGGVRIENKTGSVLPETGGIGTTLFIAIGSIVVLVCGVVLVARKRMSKYIA